MSNWALVEKAGEMYGRRKAPKRPSTINENGLLIYWHPAWPEFTVFPPKEVKRLKAYLRPSDIYPKGTPFLVALTKAADRGFPLYFRGDSFPFTIPQFPGKIITTLEELMASEAKVFWCRPYGQTIVPATCIARTVFWPQEIYSEEEVEYERRIIRDVLEALRSEPSRLGLDGEIRRAKKDLRKVSSTWDPYPRCRSCDMGEKYQETCMGVQHDPRAKDCLDCDAVIECCHLMRKRVENILDRKGKMVFEEIKASRNIDKHITFPVSKREELIVAKRKRPEDIDEEVETKEKKKNRKKSKDADKSKSRSKDKSDKKELSQKAAKARVKELLDDLDEAREDKDRTAASKIRAELRSLGYKLSDKKK